MSTENNDDLELPELTPEQEEAYLKKRFGVGSDGLMKREDVRTPQQEAEAAVERQKNIVATGLTNNWFTKDEYDGYLEATKQGDFDFAKKQFVEENKELGEKAGEIFNQVFAVDEDDEIDEIGTEVKSPNLKKKVAAKLAAKIKADSLNSKFGNVLSAEKKYDNHVQTQQRVKKATAAINALPDTMPVKVGETDYSYTITAEDKEAIQKDFLDSPTLLSKDVDQAEITENALLAFQARNFNRILTEVVSAAIKDTEDRVGRGEKGISVKRPDGNVVESEVEKLAKERGLI